MLRIKPTLLDLDSYRPHHRVTPCSCPVKMAAMFSTLLLFIYVTVFFQCTVRASCEPEYAFYPPSYSQDTLTDTFLDIQESLNALIAQQEAINDTSLAIQIASSKETLFQFYHTSLKAEENSPANKINGSTVFRIESNTKLFVALAILQQEAKGHLNLDDSVLHYLQDLDDDKSSFDFEKITIRSLLSHTSGLPDTRKLGSKDCETTTDSG